MRAMAGWMVGVLGLGLAFGSYLDRGSAAKASHPEATALSTAAEAADAPMTRSTVVSCSDGYRAIVRSVNVDGESVAHIECVNARAKTAPVATLSSESVVTGPAPARVETTKPNRSRSLKDSALIIGGSAGAGAGIGAIAKGGKGAAVGAAIGGVAGTIYDLSTRKRQ